MEPPSEESITSAVKRLQDVGAFDANDNLTALGHHLAALPVDVRIGKLMLYGAIFQVNPGTWLAGVLSTFVIPNIFPLIF